MRTKIASLTMAALALGVAANARAADFPVKAPYAARDAAFSWSGLYIGLHAGYGWGSNTWTAGPSIGIPNLTIPTMSPNSNSALGGLQAGANYQMGDWVLGAEWDFAGLGHKGIVDGLGTVPGATLPMTVTSELNWLTQLTGRAGFALDHTLLYVKGGVALGQAKDNLSITIPTVPLFLDLGTKSNVMAGWTIGGGVEHYFGANWSAKVEYNYVDLGSTTDTFSTQLPGGSLSFRQTIEHKMQIVKVGANYKF